MPTSSAGRGNQHRRAAATEEYGSSPKSFRPNPMGEEPGERMKDEGCTREKNHSIESVRTFFSPLHSSFTIHHSSFPLIIFAVTLWPRHGRCCGNSSQWPRDEWARAPGSIPATYGHVLFRAICPSFPPVCGAWLVVQCHRRRFAAAGYQEEEPSDLHRPNRGWSLRSVRHRHSGCCFWPDSPVS